MRFLIDESTGPAVAQWLRERGHDVFSVYEQARGLTDDAVILMAIAENRVLITDDKDFGEKVYREGSRTAASFCYTLKISEHRPEPWCLRGSWLITASN